MTAYYNEIEPYAAEWLRNLVAAGHLPAGDVDTRSIADVQPVDLLGYTQCHFFAGIGGWALAARLAGWPDDRELWTGSCPCQPFSVAGKQKAQGDDRHLWPHYFRLIAATRPARVMGEQVAAAISHGWLDGVFADLEGIGYACGAVVLPACAVDAPHRRDRIWFVGERCGVVGDAIEPRLEGFGRHGHDTSGRPQQDRPVAEAGSGGAVADGDGERSGGPPEALQTGQSESGRSSRGCAVGNAGGAVCERRAGGFSSPQARIGGAHGSIDGHITVGPEHAGQGGYRIVANTDQPLAREGWQRPGRQFCGAGCDPRARSFWNAHGWIIGHDGKARRVPESALRGVVDGLPAGMDGLRAGSDAEEITLLASGVAARVGKLKCLGNAIVPQVAAQVLAAFME